MKNYEKYDKEIKEILDEGFDIAVIKGKVKKILFNIRLSIIKYIER